MEFHKRDKVLFGKPKHLSLLQALLCGGVPAEICTTRVSSLEQASREVASWPEWKRHAASKVY